MDLELDYNYPGESVDGFWIDEGEQSREADEPANSPKANNGLRKLPKCNNNALRQAVDIVIRVYFERCSPEQFHVGLPKDEVWSLLFATIPHANLVNVPLIGRYLLASIKQLWKGIEPPPKHVKKGPGRKPVTETSDPWSRTLHQRVCPGIQYKFLFEDEITIDTVVDARFRQCVGVNIARLACEDIKSLDRMNEAKRMREKDLPTNRASSSKKVTYNTHAGLALPHPDSNTNTTVSNPANATACTRTSGQTKSSKRQKSVIVGPAVIPVSGHVPMYEGSVSDDLNVFTVKFGNLAVNAKDLNIMIRGDGSGHISACHSAFANSKWSVDIVPPSAKTFLRPELVCVSEQTHVCFHTLQTCTYICENNVIVNVIGLGNDAPHIDAVSLPPVHDLTGNISDHETQLAEAISEKQAAWTQLEACEDALSSMKSKYDRLKNEKTNLVQKYSHLRKNYEGNSDMKQSLSSSEERCKELESRISTLTVERDNAGSVYIARCQELESKVSALTDSKNSLKSSYIQVSGQNDELRATLERSEQQHQTLESELQQKLLDKDSLMNERTKECKELQQQMKVYEKKMSDLYLHFVELIRNGNKKKWTCQAKTCKKSTSAANCNGWMQCSYCSVVYCPDHSANSFESCDEDTYDSRCNVCVANNVKLQTYKANE